MMIPSEPAWPAVVRPLWATPAVHNLAQVLRCIPYLHGANYGGRDMMRIKTFIATVGLSAAAGAAAILMVPKNSKTFRTANDAAQAIKSEAERMAGAICGK